MRTEVARPPRRPRPCTSRPSYLPELTQTPRCLSSYQACQSSVGEGLAVDGDHLLDRQAVFLREREVALVVRRHAHHRAVAVAHQHVVADPDCDLLAGQRMRDEEAGRHAFLFHRREVGFHHASRACILR